MGNFSTVFLVRKILGEFIHYWFPFRVSQHFFLCSKCNIYWGHSGKKKLLGHFEEEPGHTKSWFFFGWILQQIPTSNPKIIVVAGRDGGRRAQPHGRRVRRGGREADHEAGEPAVRPLPHPLPRACRHRRRRAGQLSLVAGALGARHSAGPAPLRPRHGHHQALTAKLLTHS